MFEDTVNIHQRLIDLRLEVMDQYYIRKYRKILPTKQSVRKLIDENSSTYIDDI